MRKELVDLEMRLHHETDKAVLVSDDGDRDHAIWVPLSQCEIEHKKNGYVVVTMPSWLAKDKGLI
jgi:hypothetical protein